MMIQKAEINNICFIYWDNAEEALDYWTVGEIIYAVN